MCVNSLLLARLWRDEQGATAIEYALVSALISITIIVAVRQVGQNLSNTFYNNVANALT